MPDKPLQENLNKSIWLHNLTFQCDPQFDAIFEAMLNKQQDKRNSWDDKNRQGKPPTIKEKRLVVQVISPWKEIGDEKEVRLSLSNKKQDQFDAVQSIELRNFFDDPMIAI